MQNRLGQMCLMTVVYLAGSLMLWSGKPIATRDKLAASLTRLAALDIANTNQTSVRKSLGAPGNIEVRSRKTAWVYYNNRSKLVVEWEGLPANIRKLNFEMVNGPKAPQIDYRLADKLHYGETTMVQALKIFGSPAEMEMKEKSQELLYVFADKKLRMFFRERVLVDFALY